MLKNLGALINKVPVGVRNVAYKVLSAVGLSSPARICIALSPLFVAASGYIVSLAARYLPGLPHLDAAEVDAAFIAGATFMAGKLFIWLEGAKALDVLRAKTQFGVHEFALPLVENTLGEANPSSVEHRLVADPQEVNHNHEHRVVLEIGSPEVDTPDAEAVSTPSDSHDASIADPADDATAHVPPSPVPVDASVAPEPEPTPAAELERLRQATAPEPVTEATPAPVPAVEATPEPAPEPEPPAEPAWFAALPAEAAEEIRRLRSEVEKLEHPVPVHVESHRI